MALYSYLIFFITCIRAGDDHIVPLAVENPASRDRSPQYGVPGRKDGIKGIETMLT